MIRYIILCVFCLTLVNAQQSVPKKNMKVMMTWKLTEYLDLSEKQAEKFFPKMRSYEKNINDINSQIKHLNEQMEGQINSGTATKQLNRSNIDKIQQLEQKKSKIRADYLLSLENILTAKQVSKLMIFEKKFKKTLKQELKTRRQSNAKDIRDDRVQRKKTVDKDKINLEPKGK